MSEEIITYMEIYAVIIAVLFIIWTIYSAIMFIHDLPEKRKTCAELYEIRRKRNYEEKNIR